MNNECGVKRWAAEWIPGWRVSFPSRSVSVVGRESMKVAQLAQTALYVRYMDLYVILETAVEEHFLV